ncbi:MAG: hypothetical protein A2097_11985 [Desulfobacula sp. GWF2_41_7]|nr:MAG: hypothetical protein A2097_11985 [Desulfobacula sp. GWF2_41_7]
MTKLNFILKNSWPKLAWVCRINISEDSAIILHGPAVEIFENWAVEAVWDKDFEKGDFDKTDIIFGSGIRKRCDKLIFVSSSTVVDRLWHVSMDGKIFVSNTLPGLLTVAELSLLYDYPNYASDMASIIMKGLYRYKKNIPTNGPDINILYFNNLVWTNGLLEIIEKPDYSPMFNDFTTYKNYLETVAHNIGKNANSKSRTYPIGMLTGLSSGYDSVATSVISRHAGCNKAVSIENSSSFWRGSDSGQHIAKKLGFICEVVKHDKNKYQNEIYSWAATGLSGGRNQHLFNYPKPLCLFFGGYFGDTIWNRKKQNLIEPKGSTTSFCEFRLLEGIFVSVVPWWGIKHAAEIQKINLLEEMKPWTLGTDYDRPIARRLAEEAGINRGDFAIRKKDTASNFSPLLWPSTGSARASFKSFLKSIKIKPLSDFQVYILEVFYKILNLAYKNTIKNFGVRKWWRPWLNSPGRNLVFIWANHELKKKYSLKE